MASLFASTLNTRALFPDSLRYIRSDVPDRLTETEITWLIDHSVTTLVDLRDQRETGRRPCGWAKRPPFVYHNILVGNGNPELTSRGNVKKAYVDMLNVHMKTILDTIESAQTNVLYFCNAGKDRTGVVSALLLARAGADRARIVADYMLSAENLRENLLEQAARDPNFDVDVFTPHEEYITAVLDAAGY